MLITDYVVGRDNEGKPLCLVVRDVLPTDCHTGQTELVRKLARHDLIQEFVSDGMPCEWIKFPDLPKDVVELLQAGVTLKIVDAADELEVPLVISRTEEEDRVFKSKVAR